MATEITGELGGDIVDAVQGNLPKSGGTMTGDTLHGDDVKAKFGAGNDLEIYHDGSNSYIKDAGTGQLRIVTNGSEIAMLTQGGLEYGLRVIQDGAVEMRHNDSTKLATTSTGIDVTGTVTADGLNVGFNQNIQLGSDTYPLRISRAGAGALVSTISDGYDLATTRLDFVMREGSANEVTALSITGAGNVLVGTTATDTGAVGFRYRADIQAISAVSNANVAAYLGRRTTDGEVVQFRKDDTTVGSISVTGSATAYNTSSDYRLKTDVKPMTNAITTFKQLKPCNFEWIADGSRVDGFIAHELQEVIPCAATGTKDAMRNDEYVVAAAEVDEEGKETTPAVTGTRSVPDMQGIDQSKVVPLLTAALQEAIAKIESLETRLTALEDTP